MRKFRLAFFAACFCISNTLYGQTGNSKLKKVVIEYEEFMTTTIENVTCEAFRPTFKETLRTIVIGDDELSKLSLYSHTFVRTAPIAMDVRAVVRFEFKYWKVEYCTGISGVFFNKKENRYYKNKKLFDLVKKKCLVSD